MKKLAYVLFLMFTMTLITSCEKGETVDPVTEQTSGEKYPEYLGYWQNDKTTVDGVVYNNIGQWEFDIHDVKAEKIDKVGNILAQTYDSWKIEGNIISFYREGYGWRPFTIVTAPTMTSKMMVLSEGGGKLLYLSKRL